MPAFLILRTEVFRWLIGVCRLFFKDTFLNAWKNTNKCCCNIAVVKTDYIQKVLRACFQSHFYSPAGTLLLFCAKDGKSNQLLKKKKKRYHDRFFGFCLFVFIHLQIALYATGQKTCTTSLALEPDIPVSMVPAWMDASGSLAHSLVGSLNKLGIFKVDNTGIICACKCAPQKPQGRDIHLSWCHRWMWHLRLSGRKYLSTLAVWEWADHSQREFLWLPCSYPPLDQSESICPEGDLCVRSCEASVFYLWSCDRKQRPWALSDFSGWVFTSSAWQQWVRARSPARQLKISLCRTRFVGSPS